MAITTLFFILMLTRTYYYMSGEIRRLWQWENGQGSVGETSLPTVPDS